MRTKVPIAKCRIEEHTTVVPVRLTETELRRLHVLVSNNTFESRSAAMRAGLGYLFEKHGGLTPAEDMQIERERNMHRPRGSRLGSKLFLATVPKPEQKKKRKR